MGLATRIVTPADVLGTTVRVLGLPQKVQEVDTVEALAAQVRRTAAFLAPCTPRSIREAILASWRGLVAESSERIERIDSVIDSLLAYGDLLELPAREEHTQGSLLYLAQPSFVRRKSGIVFLLGISPDGAPTLPESLRHRVLLVGHTRQLEATPGEDLPGLLLQLGLNELPESLWRKRPRVVSASALVNHFEERLARSEVYGEAEGLLVLDSHLDPRYYSGRWVPPKKRTGRFVARRDQRYGSQLWSFVELEEGSPRLLIDISPEDGFTGADRAWHLQMAIDHLRGVPQRFTATPGDGDVLLQFYSPVPNWAQHRWELLGKRIPMKGCLFAYKIPLNEYQQEHELLVNQLWLKETG